jgi:hypothetical protein
LSAQVIYATNFGSSGSALPDGWATTVPAVTLINTTVPSNTYAGPPIASGSNNLSLLRNEGGSNNTLVTITVNPGISTIGKSNLILAIGNYSDPEFDRAVILDFSTDGNTWSNLSSNLKTTFNSNTTWGLDFITLPDAANNKANLQFRFTYATNNNNSNGDKTLRLDDFYLGANNNLPVELNRFELAKTKEGVLLSFSTASEHNNDYFAIKRSGNGRDFQEIGRIQGAGTSTIRQDYTYLDPTPLSGHNYYQLQQVDYDQEFSLSLVKHIYLEAPNNLSIAPSPALDFLRLTMDNALNVDAPWQIFDYSGKLLMTGIWTAESTNLEITLGALSQGMYIFHLNTPGLNLVRKFKKE